MNVRRPEWLEQPFNPIALYQAANTFKIIAGDDFSDRSVVMTSGDLVCSALSNMSAALNSLLRGMIRPERPLLASFLR